MVKLSYEVRLNTAEFTNLKGDESLRRLKSLLLETVCLTDAQVALTLQVQRAHRHWHLLGRTRCSALGGVTSSPGWLVQVVALHQCANGPPFSNKINSEAARVDCSQTGKESAS